MEPRLIDRDNLLHAAGGRQFADPFVFLVNMLLQRVGSVPIAENRCDIFADEVWISVDIHHPDG